MLRRLILHLGMGKTGSTTIQTFLKRNRAQLRKDSMLAFTPAEIQPDPHRNLIDTDRWVKAIAEVKRRVTNRGVQHLLWSLEGFGTRQFAHDPARMRALVSELPAAEVRVVVYLRRQDTFAASAYLQWNVVHKGYTGPVQPFEQRFPSVYGEGPGVDLPGTNLNYYEVVRPWAETFGVSNLRVRPLEKAQLRDGDLITDFIEASGLPARDYVRPDRSQNVTFNMELTDLLGMYASTFEGPVIPNKMDGFFNTFGNDDYFSLPFFTRFELPPATRRDILDACEPFNARVAREFLGRPDGVLFQEPWPATDAPYTPYGGMTLEKLVPILLYIMQKQHARITGLYDRFTAVANGEDLSVFKKPRKRGRPRSHGRALGQEVDHKK